MRKTSIALAITASMIAATPAMATNGDTLIGLGAQARALGGTGTALFMGSENALTNPALLGKSQGTEFTIGGTLFMPSVKAKSNVGSQPGTKASKTSSADTNIIPEVSLSSRINSHLTFGLGIFGSAGMGVDYREDNIATGGTGQNTNGNELFNAQSTLQVMKFAPSLSYNGSNFGIGFAPVIQYGALDINYTTDSDNNPNNGNDNQKTVGSGMSSDIGYGYNVGGYFNVTNALTIGLAYQSPISMKYKDQISNAASGLGLSFSDDLEQPAEIKAGIAYDMGNIALTADYKKISWASAKGYKDFNWQDQDVFAVGAKYNGQGYWAGIGYNYGDDPIKKIDDDTYQGQATDLFNNHFFPAIVTSHFTVGGGYSLTKNLALDGAIVYAPEVKKKVYTGKVTGALTGQSLPATQTYHKTTHSQVGYTLSLRMNF
ncbi:OmpP1/FadL family transporter [Galenea microaerophila]